MQRAPGLPCALYFGADDFVKLGRIVPREREVMVVAQMSNGSRGLRAARASGCLKFESEKWATARRNPAVIPGMTAGLLRRISP